MQKIKGALKSWTIRFNAWMGVLMAGLPMAQDSFPQLQPYIPADLFQKGMLVLIVGNLLLRFKTNCDLSRK